MFWVWNTHYLTPLEKRDAPPEVFLLVLLQEPFSDHLFPNQASEIELLSFKGTNSSINMQNIKLILNVDNASIDSSDYMTEP